MSAIKVTRRRAASGGLDMQVQRITPKVAEALLGKNVHNRNVRRAQVDAYARDMRAGEWHLTGEPIKFCSDGTLLDGQHRLLAVIQSGRAVDMLVVTGLPAASQSFMDSGAKRSAADQMGLSGEKSPALLASVARSVVLWDGGDRTGRARQVTYAEIVEAIDAEPEMRWSVEAADKARRLIPVTPTVFGLVHHLCARIDRGEANEFFVDQVANSIAASSQARALIQRLNKANLAGQRLTTTEQTGYMILAWNLWRNGETRARLNAPKVTGWTSATLPDPR